MIRIEGKLQYNIPGLSLVVVLLHGRMEDRNIMK